MSHRGVIQRGELNVRLARGLELRQSGGEGLLLADQVVPVVQLEDLTTQSVFQGPLDRRANGGNVQAAVAAQYGQVTLLNPIGSGIVAVVEQLLFRLNTSSPVSWGWATPIGAPAGDVTRFCDPRNWGSGLTARPACLIYSGTDAGALAGITCVTGRVGQGSTTSPGQIDVGMVLLPGYALGVVAEAVNFELSAHFRWCEYVA